MTAGGFTLDLLSMQVPCVIIQMSNQVIHSCFKHLDMEQSIQTIADICICSCL